MPANIAGRLMGLAHKIAPIDPELARAVRLYGFEPSVVNAQKMMELAAEDGQFYDALDAVIGWND